MNEEGFLARFERSTGNLIHTEESQHHQLVKCGLVVGDYVWTGDVVSSVCVWNIKDQCSLFNRFHLHNPVEMPPQGDPRFATLSMCHVRGDQCGLVDDEVWIGSSGVIRRYHRHSFQQLGEIEAHSHHDVTGLCSMGPHVWSTSNDRRVCVWDPLTGKELHSDETAHTGIHFFFLRGVPGSRILILYFFLIFSSFFLFFFSLNRKNPLCCTNREASSSCCIFLF